MAAGKIRGAVGKLLAGSADRRLACHLSLHRQRSRRIRAGQTPDRRRHARPSAAAANRQRDAGKPAAAGTVARRVLDRRWPRPGAPRPAGHRDPCRGAGRRDRAGSRHHARYERRRSADADRPLRLRHQGEPVRRRPPRLRPRRRRARRPARRRWPDGASRPVRPVRPRAADPTCCRPDATCFRSIRARCRRARRMRRASRWPRNCCAVICRTTATGRARW